MDTKPNQTPAARTAATLKALFAYAGVRSKLVGEMTGLSDAFVRALATGKRTMNASQAASIASALGADVRSLISGPIPLEWDAQTPYNGTTFERWIDALNGETLESEMDERTAGFVNGMIENREGQTKRDKTYRAVFLHNILVGAALSFGRDLEDSEARSGMINFLQGVWDRSLKFPE